MKKQKVFEILMLCVKIALPILVVVPLVYFSVKLAGMHMEDLANVGNPSYHSGTGLYVFASHTILFVCNIILTAIACICLLAANKNKVSPKRKSHLRHFRHLAMTPALSQILYMFINVIIMRIQ